MGRPCRLGDGGVRGERIRPMDLTGRDVIPVELLDPILRDPEAFGFIYEPAAHVWRRRSWRGIDELHAPPPEPVPFWEDLKWRRSAMGEVDSRWSAAGFYRIVHAFSA